MTVVTCTKGPAALISSAMVSLLLVALTASDESELDVDVDRGSAGGRLWSDKRSTPVGDELSLLPLFWLLSLLKLSVSLPLSSSDLLLPPGLPPERELERELVPEFAWPKGLTTGVDGFDPGPPRGMLFRPPAPLCPEMPKNARYSRRRATRQESACVCGERRSEGAKERRSAERSE